MLSNWPAASLHRGNLGVCSSVHNFLWGNGTVSDLDPTCSNLGELLLMKILQFDNGDKDITIVAENGIHIYVDYDDVDHVEAEYIAELIQLLPDLIESVQSNRGADFLRMKLSEIRSRREQRSEQWDN